MNADKIVILTVTYGDRSDLLRETASAALEDADVHLVVVSNGSSAKTIALLDELNTAHPERVTTLRLPTNVGSAPAFGAGLRAAYELDAPVLILDDDNPVRRDQLGELRRIAGLAPAPAAPYAIAIHRPINTAQRAILRGEPADWVFRELIPGAFHGFDLISTFRRFGGAPRRFDPPVRWGTGDHSTDLHDLPVAMWGGLYLTQEAARLGALPLEELVLYGDDNDFSRAFAAAGGSIYLTDALSIDDTEVWRPTSTARRGWRGRLPSTLSTAESDVWRLQYLFRNQAYLSRRQAERSFIARGRLTINAAVRITAFAMLSLIAGRPRLGLRLTRASFDGLRGRLGQSYPLPG